MYLSKHGYRSWFAAEPDGKNVKAAYTLPEVWLFLFAWTNHATKLSVMLAWTAKQSCSGLIMHWSLLPTFAQSLLQRVSGIDGRSPVFLIGDFNSEPSLANRWTALRGFGAARAVTDQAGNALPTLERPAKHNRLDLGVAPTHG